MIVETAFAVSPAALAHVFTVGASKPATGHFLDYVKSLAYRTNQPLNGLKPWECANCLSGAFLFRFKLVGDIKAKGIVHDVTERKVARAVATLAAAFPEEFGRIVAGTPTNEDAALFMQLCIFAFPQFPLSAPAPVKVKGKGPANRSRSLQQKEKGKAGNAKPAAPKAAAKRPAPAAKAAAPAPAAKPARKPRQKAATAQASLAL